MAQSTTAIGAGGTEKPRAVGELRGRVAIRTPRRSSGSAGRGSRSEWDSATLTAMPLGKSDAGRAGRRPDVGFGSSATSAIPGCKLVSYAVSVNFDDTRHNDIIDHAFDARRAGHPRTLRIARHESRREPQGLPQGHPDPAGLRPRRVPTCDVRPGWRGRAGASVRCIEFRRTGAPEG